MKEILKDFKWVVLALGAVILAVVMLYFFLILGGFVGHFLFDIVKFGWNLLN
jgi:hypothetical protein